MKHFFQLSVLVFALSCAQLPHFGQRNPAQLDPSSEEVRRLEQDQKLEKWSVVKEGFWDRIYTDPLLGFFVNSDYQVAYELIKDAQTSIDIEIYEMKDPIFRKLLLEAQDRGIKLRIVKDSNTVGDQCNELEPVQPEDDKDCEAEKEYVAQIQSKGGEYVFFDKRQLCGIPGRSCYQHGKMIITDRKYLLMSSGNFNTSSFCSPDAKFSKCNRDYSYVTKNRYVLKTLQEVWEKDFKGETWDFKETLSDGHPGVTVSPVSNPRLISLLKSAKKSVWIQNQYLEDPAINEVLLQKAREGLDVKIQVSAFCNFGFPSESKRNKSLKIYSDFEEAGAKTKIFHAKMKINDTAGYLHSKSIVIDEQVGWIGSINGSVTASLQNREFGIIFNEKKSIASLVKVMSEDFNHPLAMEWRDSLECKK